MVHPRLQGRFDKKTPAAPLGAQRADAPPRADAGEHHPRAQLRQADGPRFGRPWGGVGGHRFLQQQRRLGQVGQNQVGPGAQALHGADHLRPKGAVQLSAVPQHRVHQLEGLRPQGKRLLHQMGLGGVRQIPGIDGVKPHAKALIMGQRGRAVARVGQLGRGAQTAGVGGQHRRGQRHRLHPQRGQNWHDDRQCRPPVAGQVMDAQHRFGTLGKGHGISSFM